MKNFKNICNSCNFTWFCKLAKGTLTSQDSQAHVAYATFFLSHIPLLFINAVWTSVDFLVFHFHHHHHAQLFGKYISGVVICCIVCLCDPRAMWNWLWERQLLLCFSNATKARKRCSAADSSQRALYFYTAPCTIKLGSTFDKNIQVFFLIWIFEACSLLGKYLVCPPHFQRCDLETAYTTGERAFSP